jgi:hypothetical protein
MTLTSKPLAALVVAILLGGILFSTAMGWWQTESTKEAAVFSSGEYAGQADPADIRGSYTFSDVEKNFGVPPAILVQAFNAQTDDPAAFQVKSLEEMYASSPEEVGTSSVRLFVAFYLGLPFDLSIDTYLPESAASLLRQRNMTAEQAAYLEAHTIPNPETGSEISAAEATPQPVQTLVSTPTHQPGSASEDSSESTVKGKTTFAELLEWGISKEAIEEALGMPMPAAPGMAVKDFCTENGLSFETIKPALQAEVDKVK